MFLESQNDKNEIEGPVSKVATSPLTTRFKRLRETSFVTNIPQTIDTAHQISILR
jgi:hypothetical protein